MDLYSYQIQQFHLHLRSILVLRHLHLSSSLLNSTISGFTDSSGSATFTSSGTLQTVESSTLRMRNADVQRIPQSDSRTLTDDSTRLVIQNTFQRDLQLKLDGLTLLHNHLKFLMSMVYILLSVMFTSQKKIQTNYLLPYK